MNEAKFSTVDFAAGIRCGRRNQVRRDGEMRAWRNLVRADAARQMELRLDLWNRLYWAAHGGNFPR